MSVQGVPWERVDRDFRLLPDSHMGQLRFLVVCNHPNVGQGRESRDLTAYSHELSRFDLTLSDHTVLSRCDRGVAKVDPRGIERGSLRGDGGLALCDLCFEDRELALRRECLRAILRKLRGNLRPNG